MNATYRVDLALDEPIATNYVLASIALAALDSVDSRLVSIDALSAEIDDSAIEVDAGLEAIAETLRLVSDSDDDDEVALDALRRDASLLASAIDDLVRAKRQRTANRERANEAFANALAFARLADSLDDDALARFSIATEPLRDDSLALRRVLSRDA